MRDDLREHGALAGELRDDCGEATFALFGESHVHRAPIGWIELSPDETEGLGSGDELGGAARGEGKPPGELRKGDARAPFVGRLHHEQKLVALSREPVTAGELVAPAEKPP
jgi:hypothetical protein